MRIRRKVTPSVSSPPGEAATLGRALPKPKDRLGPPVKPAKQQRTTPLPSVELGAVTLPGWVPATFELDSAAAALRSLLSARGVSTARVHELVVADADDTLLQTQARTVLRHAVTGELQRHPLTGEPIRLGAELEAERADLERQLPELPWAQLVNDYREFDDAKAITVSPPIGITVDALKDAASNPDARRFILTARTGADALSALSAAGDRLGLGVNSVLSARALELGDAPLGTAQRKALMLAALVELYRPKHAEVDHVTFYDDSDGNLAAAKELLPLLFPKTRFDFIDVVRQPDGSFSHVPL